MTDNSGGAKKTNKWLWPALAALVLVGILAWAFDRGGDADGLAERMASDPVSRQPAGAEMGQPNPPAQGASTLVPDNADGNASVITEADRARTDAAGVAGAGTGPSAAPNTGGSAAGSGAAMQAPPRPELSGADGREQPAPGTARP